MAKEYTRKKLEKWRAEIRKVDLRGPPLRSEEIEPCWDCLFPLPEDDWRSCVTLFCKTRIQQVYAKDGTDNRCPEDGSCHNLHKYEEKVHAEVMANRAANFELLGKYGGYW